MASPLDRSHRRAVQSELAVTRYAASTENTQSHTHLLCPAASFLGFRVQGKTLCIELSARLIC
jgi:hypothetical protein